MMGQAPDYEKQAQEARAKAAKLNDTELRRIMLQIAETYEQLAQHAEEQSYRDGRS